MDGCIFHHCTHRFCDMVIDEIMRALAIILRGIGYRFEHNTICFNWFLLSYLYEVLLGVLFTSLTRSEWVNKDRNIAPLPWQA